MSWTVETETVTARRLAVVKGAAPQPELPKHLTPAFDRVFDCLKPQGVKLGPVIALYHGLKDGRIVFEAGVEVFGDFAPCQGVVASETPAGLAAHIAYVGPYDRLGAVADAIHTWAREIGRKSPILPQWEIYGDWSEDETQLHTDVYGLLEPS